MVATGGLMHSLNNRPTGLELDDAAEIARIYQRHQLARRVRRVSRIAIIAAKKDITSRQRRLLAWQRSYRNAIHQLRANQYRIAAACAVLVFGISTVVPSFLQADTSKSTTLDAQVKALIGDTRDDASKYLTFDSKKSTYSFAVPEAKATDSSEHTGRNIDAYSTDMPVNARDGLTVTDTNTKIAVTLKPEFYMTPARKTDGNNLVYRSGNKQVIYTHKYNGLKEDIVLTAYQDSTMSFTFTLRLPSGVEARLDKQGNIGIYSSDPTLFGNISFDKEQDRISVEKAREKGEKTHRVMTIPYPIVKDSSGKEFSDRANFTLGDKRTTKSSVDTSSLPAEVAKASAGQTQLNEYTLTLQADHLKNLTYPISIDPTMQVRDAAEFGKLNIESGSDLDTTNSLIKRGGLTGGGLVSWNSNTTHLPYSAQKHGATMYNGYLYIHGGLTATGNDFRVYYASIDTTTGTIGAFNPASGVVGAGRSTHAIFAYNGFFYIVGNGTAGGTGPTTYAKINSDGTLGTFTAATNQIIGRRFASYSLVNGYLYVAGGCTAFSSAVDTGDCTAFASTVEYAQIKPDGSLSAWQNTSAFTGNRMLGSMTTYNGTLYYAGGQDDGDLINNAVSFNTVFYAKQNSDGTLSAWQTNTMPGAKQSHQSVAYNGYIYEVGGYNAVVYYAPLYVDGSIGTWITDTPMPGQYAIGVLLAANNNLFLVGGSSASTGDEILLAQVKAPGEPIAVTPSGDFDTSGRLGPAAVAYKGFLYVTGGSTDNGLSFSSVIRKASIGADGSLSGWTNTTNTFSKSRYQHGVVVHNGYMYIYGGYGTCGFLNALDYCNDVQYASIGTNGDLAAFTTSINNMLVARAAFSGVVYNGYLYTIGGRTSAGRQSDIDYAQIGVDNSVGAWQNNPASLSRPQELHGVTAYGGLMYITGGYDGTTIFRDIQYATINKTNGQIGVWTMVNPGDVGAWGSDKYGHAVWAYNGYLYQAGGCGANDGGSPCSNGTNDLQYRKIQSDGSIAAGAWTLSGQSISSDFEVNIGWAVSSDTVYFMGGRTDTSTIHKDVNRIRINNGGSGNLTTWSASGNALTSARGQFSTAVSNGYIYVIGGTTSSGDLSEILYTSVSNQGVLGSWQTSSTSGRNLPFTRSSHTSVVHSNYVFVFEGNTSDTSRTRYAKLLTTGGIASDAGCGSVWCGAAASGTNRSSVPSAYWKGYVYLSGSCTSSYCTSVEYAKLLDTGGIAANSGCGASWCSTTSLTRGRSLHQMVVYAGNLYVVGGFTSDATPNFINSVEYATIASNGSLGAWNIATILPNQERNAAVLAMNGFIYIVGGQYGTPGSGTAGTGVVKDTMYAPILKSGAVGSWQFSTNVYSQTRAQSGVVSLNGYIIDLGGDNAATTKTYYNNVDVTVPQAILRTGQLSRLYDFDVGVRPTKLITRGFKQTGSQTTVTYMSSNNMTNALDTTQTLADVGYDGSNPVTISLGTNRTLSRYLYLRYLIDDSQSATFPDSGNESYITDFDMYYTSNPGTRLRGGRTFTNGADRGLEANPQ